MNSFKLRKTLFNTIGHVVISLLLAPTLSAAPLTLSSTPLFITPTVAPNILVIMDNSQSMDGFMSGTLVSGNNPNTRGNIGRSVMRDVINSYRSTFNWGLMSYGLSAASPTYNTYAYYIGSDTGMNFTSTADCVGGSTTPNADSVYTPGVSTATGKRCVHNPQPFAGGEFVTYDKSGDDVDILDVLYDSGTYTKLWGLTAGAGTSYNLYTSHNLVNSWTSGDFSGSLGTASFTPTDAGFLSNNPPYTRQLYLPRVLTGSGQCAYNSNITGYGALSEAVKVDSTAHYNNLIAKLSSETCTAGSSELKNAAVFTPTRGTLISTRQYFAGTNGFTTPITSSCQKNFTVMVTDGLPTGDTSGNLYSAAARTNTYNSGTNTWTFGAAAKDAINEVCALQSPFTPSALCTRSAPVSAPLDPPPPGDIPVYVLALSDTLQNAGAVAVMNAMATAGGTGSAYFATSPAAFTSAFNSIASDILGRIGAAASVATTSGTLIAGSRIFQAKFTSSNWSSDLLAFPINSSSGNISTTADWQGGTVSWVTGATTATQTPSARNIFTYKPSTGKGIPFLWPADITAPSSTELDINQTTALNKNISAANDGLGSNRLDYLRGDASKEGTGASDFRIRATNKLGDIIDSAPVFVSKPDAGYPAALEGALGSAADYSNFRDAKSTRTKILYVGANDGMLHGFDTSIGKEIMAYVPSKTYANLSALSAPSYSHKYFVNGSPTVADVFYGGAWHTVLVGSLAQGGQSIFALDITNPDNFAQSVTNAQNLVLWEFNDIDNPATTPNIVDGDRDLGYTLSQPAVGRVCTSRTGATCNTSKWVAIFGNGYNNTEADGNASTTGYAYLYVVDIQNGNLLAKIDTKTGSAATPNGLGSPSIVDVDGDYYIDYVYAGDLQGNMWKFDFTGSNSNAWGVAYGSSGSPKPLYQAKDAAGTVQPITTRPQVTTHPTGNGYLVFFGTGKYLEPSVDVATTGTQTQTFYGIWDNGAQVTSITTRNSSILQQQAIDAETANARHITLNSVNYATQFGWYMDLCLNTGASGSCANNYGEKQVSNPLLLNGRILFTTLLPDSTACYGGSSWIMALDFATGGRTLGNPFDLNGDSSFNSSDFANFGGSIGSGQANGAKINDGIVGTPTTVFNPQTNNSSGYNQSSKGTLGNQLFNLGAGVGRVSWRELLNQ